MPVSRFTKVPDRVASDTRTTSGPFAIDWRDLLNGAIFAVGSAVLPLIQQSLSSGAFDWGKIGSTALSVFITYLTVKYFSPKQQITTFDRMSFKKLFKKK